MILLHKQFRSCEIPGGKLDAVIIVIDIVDEALVSSFSMRLHSCNSSEIDECMSCTGYWNCLTVHAKGLACDLVTLRCVLDGHVEVPHLADAEKDRCSSLFKDVDVGTARRSCVISKMQAPIYPGGLSVCKSELVGDDVFHCWIACQLPIDLVHPLSRIA